MVFVLIGCGVMAQPEDDKNKLKLPQKVSVEVPEVLRDKNNTSIIEKIKVDRIKGEATGYTKVKEYITEVETVVNEIKSNLFLGDQIIEDVAKYCEGTLIDAICNIPNKTLSLVVSNEIVDSLRLLVPAFFEFGNPATLKGEELFFGVVEFIRHDANDTYQYSLQMDMSEINGRLAFYDTKNAPIIIQFIKWSEDENKIFSSITTKYEDGLDFPWTLQYYNSPNDEESMHLNDRTIGNNDYPSSSRIFSLAKKYDDKKTSLVKLNSLESQILNLGISIERLSSFIKLSNEGGVQKFTQSNNFLNTETKTNREEVFDVNGTLLATTYCRNSSIDNRCQLYEPSTWFIDTEDESIFDVVSDVYFEELKIDEGNLKDGEYLLVPTGSNVTKLTAQEVLKLRVGEFTVIAQTRQGVLYDMSLVNKLDKLQVIYAKYNDNLELLLADKANVLFEVISNEDRPQITLWKDDV
jgi:hypothetical protein